MSILINKDTRLIVQGITGRDGSFHAAKMKEYGTNVVGGTSPGKGGQEPLRRHQSRCQCLLTSISWRQTSGRRRQGHR